MAIIRLRFITGLMAVTLALASLAACGDDDESGAQDTVSVVASTSIISALTAEVGGEHVEVETLMGPGVDPHTFEMTPGDARTVSGADLILINGLEFDNFLVDDVEEAGEGPEIVVVSDGIELLEAGAHAEHDGEDADHDESDHEEDHEEEHEDDAHADEDDEHEHGDHDPHIWQDPLRVKEMVGNIADALAAVDPDNAQEYRDNSAAYQETLDETHMQIQELIAEIPEERRKIVTNHDAFAYFADRYGLQIVGTVIPGTSSEAEPSAGDIADLTATIEEEGVTAIFAEDLIDPIVAEALARDAGVEIVYGLYSEQVGDEGSGADSVHGMLLANAEKFNEALR